MCREGDCVMGNEDSAWWACRTCGVEHAEPVGVCAICADERQYMPASGVGGAGGSAVGGGGPCGVERAEPVGVCAICADERQYMPASGQQWTTLEELAAAGHRTQLREIEPNLFALTVEPRV